jgi:hypothetical protein
VAVVFTVCIRICSAGILLLDVAVYTFDVTVIIVDSSETSFSVKQ